MIIKKTQSRKTLIALVCALKSAAAFGDKAVVVGPIWSSNAEGSLYGLELSYNSDSLTKSLSREQRKWLLLHDLSLSGPLAKFQVRSDDRSQKSLILGYQTINVPLVGAYIGMDVLDQFAPSAGIFFTMIIFYVEANVGRYGGEEFRPTFTAGLKFPVYCDRLCEHSSGRPLRDQNGNYLFPALDSDLVSAQNPALANYWIQMARAESASVPAFAYVKAQLGRLEAPEWLLAACDQAMAEETKHADLCLARAQVITGQKLRLGPQPTIKPVVEDTGTLVERMIRENICDGWLGEGQASAIAGLQKFAVRDASEREIFSIIEQEERSHANLSFEVLRFLRERYPNESRHNRIAQNTLEKEAKFDLDSLAKTPFLAGTAREYLKQERKTSLRKIQELWA